MTIQNGWVTNEGKNFGVTKQVEWFENKTDPKFRDNMNYTAGAVNSFDDVRDLSWVVLDLI